MGASLHVRCPKDVDPSPSASSRHWSLTVRLPLGAEEVGALLVAVALCPCGERMRMADPPEVAS